MELDYNEGPPRLSLGVAMHSQLTVSSLVYVVWMIPHLSSENMQEAHRFLSISNVNSFKKSLRGQQATNLWAAIQNLTVCFCKYSFMGAVAESSGCAEPEVCPVGLLTGNTC